MSDMHDKLIFTVDKDYDGSDVKTFLRRGKGVSSRLLKKLKAQPDGILLNGEHVFVTRSVCEGDKITLVLPKKESVIPADNLHVNVLYEDEYIIVFDKPSNMTVHPVHEYVDNTLANFAAYYAQCKGESYIFRAVNRLDRDTSGCVLCAKNAYTANLLKGNVSKKYYAVCEGTIERPGTVNKQIALKPDSKIVRQTVETGGKPSVTHYVPIKCDNRHTMLEIALETGRTHQIRVHMADMGHPLAGDDLYGGSMNLISRQALHCGSVEINLPCYKKPLTVTSPIPDDMRKIFDDNR